MINNIKKTVTFLFFLVAGILLGSAVAYLTAGISWLSWLGKTSALGVSTHSPLVLDLIVFKFAFGLELTVNVAQVICVIIAMILHTKFCKGT